MKIIVALLFIFCIGAYVFSEQARTRKISWGCVLIPKKFKTVCEATISLERLFRREIHRCRLAQQSFAFHSRVFRFRTCAEKCAELGRLSVSILVLSCVQRGLGLFDLLVIDLLWWRNTKRTRFSFLPEKKYYQNPKKHIESFCAVSRCLPQSLHCQP